MFAVGQKEMSKLDIYTVQELGLPGVVLMENAGAKVVEEIQPYLTSKKDYVVVLAGAGSNGGDGFVIARKLHDLGIRTLLVLVVDVKKIRGDAKIHWEAYNCRNLPVLHRSKIALSKLQDELEQATVIVDAMLGVGVKGVLRSPYREVVLLLQQMGENVPIIAVDIPTGVNSDTGQVREFAVKATKTVTFVYPKKGFFLQEGPMYIGDWKVVDISIPQTLADTLQFHLPAVITPNLIQTMMPQRPTNGHKGIFGHLFVIGGSTRYVGAPTFSAKAALMSGVGLVTLATPQCIYEQVSNQCPEALLLPLKDQEGYIALSSIDTLQEELRVSNSVVIGPGLGRFQNGQNWMKKLLAKLDKQPVVIDADGLYHIRNDLYLLKMHQGAVIITPHPGEMAMLLNMSIQDVERNRLEIAQQLARTYEIYVVLKGHRSIIATPTGEVFINPFGHDALSKGGTGDVLAGMIGSFLAQGFSPTAATVCACYFHARAGELSATELSHYSVLPMDLIHAVRQEINKHVFQ